MQTVQPCVTIGSYIWAQDRLPYDEFALRLDALRAAMERNGWPAVLVYGDVREHAALAFLTSFIPRVRWGMALLPRTGDARLLCAMSTRDLPAMRTLTWIADVRSGMGPEWQKAFDPWFERFAGDQAAKLGTLGFDIMAPVLHAAVRRSLGERFSFQRADDVVGIPARRKRPRELTMIRASCKLLEAAAKTFAESWRGNYEPETAALDAERVARSLAAQDVRTLVSLDGGRTLVPFQGRFEKSVDPLVGYLAVKAVGYWADMFVTVDDVTITPAARHAEAALDAIIANMRPGARTGAIHTTALGALAPYKLHPVLGGSIGHGIGLSLHEGPEFQASGDATLVEDGVYVLQVGAADAKAGNVLLSAIVRVMTNGAEVLLRSPSSTSSPDERSDIRGRATN
jgi:Xaa-Pro aminopeptidase